MSLEITSLEELKEIKSKEYIDQKKEIAQLNMENKHYQEKYETSMEIIDDLRGFLIEKNQIIKELKESSISMGPIVSANQQIASENIKLKERIKELEEEDPDECEDCEVIRQHLGEQVKRQELRYQKLQLRNKRFNDALTVFNNTINNIKEYDEC